MMKEVTKRQMFEAMVNFANGGALEYFDEKSGETIEVTDEVLRTFAEHEIQLLDKKAAKAKETAAKKKKEDPLYDVVKCALTEEFRPITEITKDIIDAGYEGVTSAKVTYRLNKLVEAGEAEKTPIKVGETGKTRTVQGYRQAHME
jgi:hypothetical protein